MVSMDELNRNFALLEQEAASLPDHWTEKHVEATAARLTGLQYTPPVITPVATFLRLRNDGLIRELQQIMAMEEPPGQKLVTEDWAEAQLGHMQVLMFYYRKLIALRSGDADAWDEVDELYVHD